MNRSEQARKWLYANTELKMSFADIVKQHNKDRPDDIVNVNIVAGAVYRYRQRKNIPAQNSPIRGKNDG